MRSNSFFALLFLIVFSFSFTAEEPLKITWDILKDVTFKKKWNEKESIFMLFPTFGANLKKYENKTVTIKGFMVPVDPESNQYVLSAFPYSMCFFCGGAGPESVMTLKMKKNRKFKTDEMHTFRGRLDLNAEDIYELNYILTDAEVIE
jgi:hypothetical protein